MIPEIKFLKENFTGNVWNPTTQTAYIERLKKEDFFEGTATNNPAFSARDRINRAPKALGFVDLDPVINITEPGEGLISGIDVGEVLLRQMLKFQLPSPYHKMKYPDLFRVKPYLEILRLIRTMGSISFDELCLFGMQLTDYHLFDTVKSKIEGFRAERKRYSGGYKKFIHQKRKDVVMDIYRDDIESGDIETRESPTVTTKDFVEKKYSNLRDYTDACIRYLRETGMITISRGIQSNISIMEDKLNDVDLILNTVDREPVNLDLSGFKVYLFDPTYPELYSDDKSNLIEYLMKIGPFTKKNLMGHEIGELRRLKRETIEDNKRVRVDAERADLKTYQRYQDIMDTYDNMMDTYDSPLMLEWNTWRAMTMINDGEIVGNFKLDDLGWPMSTAPGNKPDISCHYDCFGLTVEVTLRSGQKQFDTEGESIARHLGKFKAETGKKSYCLFIAPTINNASIVYFYGLCKIPIAAHGGTATIIPISLADFRYMIDNAYNSSPKPTSDDLLEFLEYAEKEAHNSENENEWFGKISDKARNWMRLA